MTHPAIGKPHDNERPVEQGVHLSRQSRRILASTGVVNKNVPSLKSASSTAALNLWKSIEDRQVVVWLDNWYRKRFSCDPINNDMSLNVSAMALLHVTEIPIFPGYLSLGAVVDGISSVARLLACAAPRLRAGVDLILENDLQREWIRVPLDVQRTAMRSLQWLPYVLTEETVSNQLDLLSILQSLQAVHNQTRRAVPLLVDMDIHYRILKLIYGSATSSFDFGRSMSFSPILYGVCHGNNEIKYIGHFAFFNTYYKCLTHLRQHLEFE